MRILLLGGTGAMGKHLSDILANDKNEVFVTTRKKRVDKENIKYIEGNAHNSDFLEALLKEKYDCIVDFMAYTTDEFKIRAEKLLSSTEHYIFLSSSRVYAESKTLINENSSRLLDVCTDKEYLATDEYALAKARQENILFESSHKNWTIIRPYITYSENRLQLGVLEKEFWLFATLNCHSLIFSKDIAEHTTTLTYGYDVARGIASIIGNKKAFGEAFHITGNNAITWQKVYELYADVLKENGCQFEEILRAKTYRLESNGKYQVLYDRYYDRIFDNSKIAQFINMADFIKPEDGLKKCLAEFLKNPKFIYTPVVDLVKILKGTGNHIPISKIQGCKQKIKYILTKAHLYQ